MPRWPTNDSCPRWRSTCTVGVSSAKSWKRRPLIGRSRIAVPLTMLSEVDWDGSINDAATSISVLVSSICSVMSARTVVPTLTKMPSIEERANPSVSARIVYEPGSTVEDWYSPARLERNARTTPVVLLTSVTCASATEAPAGSRTTPMIRPLWAFVWAESEPMQITSNSTGRTGIMNALARLATPALAGRLAARPGAVSTERNPSVPSESAQGQRAASAHHAGRGERRSSADHPVITLSVPEGGNPHKERAGGKRPAFLGAAGLAILSHGRIRLDRLRVQ